MSLLQGPGVRQGLMGNLARLSELRETTPALSLQDCLYGLGVYKYLQSQGMHFLREIEFQP